MSQLPLNSSIQLKKPWKYIGYRGFSAFISSDDDFLVFRRFGALTARVLLGLQDQLSVFEEELEALDAKHSRTGSEDIHNGSFRQEAVPERTELLSKIHSKLREYSQLNIYCLSFPLSEREHH